MSYTINKSDKSILLNLPDGSIDEYNTSIKLVGKNASGYGESINENFVHLLENFSSNIQPQNPLIGQLWFDKSINKLKTYLGISRGWTRIENISVGTEAPAVPYKGDLWYDENQDTLKFYSNNNSWINIGLGASAAGSVSAKYIKDISGANKPIMQFSVGNKVVAIVSSNEKFQPAGDQLIEGTTEQYNVRFPLILKGITLNNENGTDDKNNYKFNGIASSAYYADLAERYQADKYIEPGSVIKIGGKKQITTTTSKADIYAFSVISTSPGLELNADAGDDITHPFVVLVGKTKCKVIGKLNKGDYIMSSDIEGTACKWEPTYNSLAIIGISLQNKKTESMGLIEVVIK